jgi:MFS transporter, OFA family, oxalate/formate antiporter
MTSPPNDKAKTVSNRWSVVVGAVLIQFCLGAIYAWSVFTPALTNAGWSNLQTQLVFAIGLVTFALVMVWAGRALKTIGPRKLAVYSGLVLGAGYTLAGLFGGTNFYVVAVCIGLIGGAGIGLGYVVPIAVGMRWFPDKKGLITGLAVAGFGFGAMLWVKLADSWGRLLETFGLSATFVIYGLIFATLVLLGSIWMVFPREGWLPPGYTPPQPKPEENGEDDIMGEPAAPARDLRSGEMLSTVQFYLIFLAFAVSAGAGLMSIGLMKLYPMEALQAAGMPLTEAKVVAGTAMAVFFSLANGIGRIAWGSISDLVGRKRSILLMTSSQGFLVIMFTAMAGSEWWLYLGAACIGFNFGGNFALFPTVTADVFGSKNVGQNYPFVFLAYGVGGVAGPILGGMLGDMGNFPLAFTICGIACIVGAAMMSMVTPVKTKVRNNSRAD